LYILVKDNILKKEQFIEFLEEHILPIFTGSEISGEEQSSPRDAQVAQGVGGSILAKFNKQDEYRIIIKRIQPFKTIEVSLVKSIIEELKELSQYTIKNEYIKKFQSYAIEKAICKAVSQKSSVTLLELISEISIWSQRTYEGHYSSFGFVMSPKKMAKVTNENLHFSNMLSRDFSALLSDGVNTFLEISADGYLIGYITAPRTNDYNILSPYEFSKIANISEGNKIGISLLTNGDILLFKDQMLVFAKKNGFWTSYSHEEIIHRIADKTKESAEDIRKAIYLTALDTSFSKSGGCIVHLNKDDIKEALKHIDVYDILMSEYYQIKIEENLNYSFLEEKMQEQKIVSFEDFVEDEKCIKIVNLCKVIDGRKFNELDRNLRKELVAIDGATVIDNDGNIVAIGAIIKIEAGSTGGGRLAATKTLSKYGVAIKISADGSIEGYHFDKNRNKTKPLFFL
jgi:hypothetical protein